MADKNFRAIKALSYRRRVIRKGERVPTDYPRFDEGIRRGWIVEEPVSENNPVTSFPASEPAVEATDEITKLPETELTDKFEEVEEGISEETETKSPIILGDLEFLKQEDIAELTKAGLVTVADLEGWSYEQLVDIKYIGRSKATQLLDAYEEHRAEPL